MRYSDKQNFKSLIFLLFLYSCQISVKKEIKVEKYYPDGRVESRVSMQNGKKNGIASLFYPTGKLKEEGKWVNDKQEGLWIFYYEEGRISGKINFINDFQDGQSTFYFPNGSLDQEVQFKDGAPNGISKSYYRDITKVKEQSEWVLGKRNGTVIIFDSMGNNFKKYLYKDDKLIKEY